jgi:hypothetical protein
VSDLVVGEVRGYRAWRLSREGYLGSLADDHRWDWATEKANCYAWRGLRDWTDHSAPFTGCTCGLYAYYRPKTVPPVKGQVFGVVSVTGRVILATRGMKAERMTILALVTDDPWPGELYGVPIYPNRKALLSDFPPQGYGELVDVDPTDPLFGIGGRPATVGAIASGLAAGMRKAAEHVGAVTARAAGTRR